MKDFTYKILNPGGNRTALINGADFTSDEKKNINDKILKENSDVEQVGFLNDKENRLEMAGGEFCANASRCAIYEYLNGTKGEAEISVSGVEGKIKGGINNNNDVYVELKLKQNIDEIINKQGIYNFVELDGIMHVVIDEKNSKRYIDNLKNGERAIEDIKEILSRFKTDKSAIGMIFLENNKKSIKIYPVVWVKTIDTLYYETACGSGSLAAAIYKKYVQNINDLSVLQPSGYNINVKLNIKNNYIENAIISGKVEDEKEVYYGRI